MVDVVSIASNTLTERLSALRRSARMQWLRFFPRILLIGALLVLVGCSFSTSSRMTSDFLDSSESSSRSSTSKERHSRYREDVRSYTAAYVRSGGQFDAFTKELGELARRHGLTNWEDDQTTYVGVGAGLGAAAVGEAPLETYTTILSLSDSPKKRSIQ